MTGDRLVGTVRPGVVVMGVSGSGKTTIAEALAARLGGVFFDADDLHSPDAKHKMAQGIALTDDDRLPWLRLVAGRISAERDAGPVMACSALRRGYRDVLRADSGIPLRFVHLTGSEELLQSRIRARTGHFMSAGLLDSQLATLEPLAPDEIGVVIDVAPEPDVILDRIVAALERVS